MTKPVIQSTLICPTCGNTFPIMRKVSAQRKIYHRKKIYCLYCKRETNHIETQDLDKLVSELNFKEESVMTNNEKMVYKLIKRRG